MESSVAYVKIAWLVNMVFFTVILVFIWSRISILQKKSTAIQALVTQLVQKKEEYENAGEAGFSRPEETDSDKGEDSQ